MRTKQAAKHTPRPRSVHERRLHPGVTFEVRDPEGVCIATMVYREDDAEGIEATRADALLDAAAPDLLSEARVLRCLATSPRFQRMPVVEALAELKASGCGHDDGAALAKAEGSR